METVVVVRWSGVPIHRRQSQLDPNFSETRGFGFEPVVQLVPEDLGRVRKRDFFAVVLPPSGSDGGTSNDAHVRGEPRAVQPHVLGHKRSRNFNDAWIHVKSKTVDPGIVGCPKNADACVRKAHLGVRYTESMTPEIAAEKLAQLAKKIAWSPHSGLHSGTRTALRQAVAAFERAKKRPTAFDHILSDDDDIYEKDADVLRCAYSKCRLPMMDFRHGRRKYHTDECRKKAFHERSKGQAKAEVKAAKARVKATEEA
jgi:hypothetical protein